MEEIIANNLNKPLIFGILCENVELAYQVRDSIIKFMESFPKITQLPFMSQNYEHIYVEQVKHWILNKNNNECYKRPTIGGMVFVRNLRFLDGTSLKPPASSCSVGSDKRPTFNSGEILNYNILEGYNPNFSCNNKHIIKMLMFPRELKTHTFYIDVVDSDCPLSMNKIYPYLRTNFDAIYLFKNTKEYTNIINIKHTHTPKSHLI